MSAQLILSSCHNGVHIVYGIFFYWDNYLITTKNITCSVHLDIQSVNITTNEFAVYIQKKKLNTLEI